MTGAQVLFENSHERDDEAAEDAANHPRIDSFGRIRVCESPSPGGGRYNAEQEQARLVDGALQRHRFADGYLTLESFFV